MPARPLEVARLALTLTILAAAAYEDARKGLIPIEALAPLSALGFALCAWELATAGGIRLAALTLLVDAATIIPLLLQGLFAGWVEGGDILLLIMIAACNVVPPNGDPLYMPKIVLLACLPVLLVSVCLLARNLKAPAGMRPRGFRMLTCMPMRAGDFARSGRFIVYSGGLAWLDEQRPENERQAELVEAYRELSLAEFSDLLKREIPRVARGGEVVYASISLPFAVNILAGFLLYLAASFL